MSLYQCSKLSGIPYTTLSEVVPSITKIEKRSVETVYKLPQVLNVTMEGLIMDSPETRVDFEIFKSNACHRVKEHDDLDFIVITLQEDDISRY